MENHPKVTPKDFFLWAGAIITLYWSIGSLVSLLFDYIDHVFGDSLTYIDPYSTGMRVAIASLIIIFPLYLWLTRILNTDIRRTPLKKDLWIRRWLLSLTLFFSALTMVIDLIVLIQNFLGGEDLTAAFLLKVLVVLVVAGGAFLYYLQDIRGYWERNERQAITVGIVVALLVLGSIITGFFIMGSPRAQRLMRYDAQKVSDLQNVQYQVTNYYQQKGKIPASLADLDDPLSGFTVPKDPQATEGTTYAYEYVTKTPLSFQLCATFNQAAQDSSMGQTAPITVGGLDEHWQHDAGHYCFMRTIDPDKYPLYNKGAMQ